MNRREILRMFGAAAVVAGSGTSWAQGSKPIRIILPYPAGGGGDVMARLLAVPVGKALQRVVIVDNRPGANALIGTRAVQSSPPDGDTLLFANEALVYNPLLNKEAAYDPIKDFTPVSIVAWGSLRLVAHSSVPANNVAELIAWGKTQPKAIEVGIASLGSISHLLTAKFARMTGIKVLYVPYKGGAETTNALMAGEIKLNFALVTGVLEAAAKAGQVKILATTANTRSTYAPDLPSISETIPGFENRGWWGVLASAGTPAGVVARLNRAFTEAMADPFIREKFLAVAMESATSTPDEFARSIREKVDYYAKLIAEENASVR